MFAIKDSERIIKILFIFIISALALLAYWPSLSNGLWGDSLAFVHQCWLNGLATLNPAQKWSFDSVSSYWLQREQLTLLLGNHAPQPEQYLPPLPQLLMLLQNSIFGANFMLYHLFSLLLLVFSALVLKNLVLNLQGNKIQAYLAATIFVIHPALTFDVARVSAQSQLLLTLFWLLSANAIFNFKYSKYHLVKLSLFLLGGFFSDTLMLTILPVAFLIAYQKQNRVDQNGKQENIQTAKMATYLVMSLSAGFLLFRLCMPWLSGAHSLEGWYNTFLLQAVMEPLRYWFSSAALWFTVLPPRMWVILPLLKTLIGALIFVVAIIVFLRIVKRKSALLDFALLSFLLVEILSFFNGEILFGKTLSAACLSLISVDLLRLLFTKLKYKAFQVVLILLLLFVFKLAIEHNHGNQAIIATDSKTSDQYSSQLIEELGDVPHQARIYIFNFWSQATMLPLEVELKLKRKDVKAYLMTPHFSPVPYNLPLVDSFFTRWTGDRTKINKNDSKLQFSMIDKNVLLVKAQKGVFFRTQSELNHKQEYMDIPAKKEMKGEGFSVATIGKRQDNAPTALRITFDEYIMDPKNIFMIWDNGGWKKLAIDNLRKQGKR